MLLAAFASSPRPLSLAPGSPPDQQCYKTLIFDFDILDGPCLKYSLSKGLGLGIVLGGSIVKIPQVRARPRPVDERPPPVSQLTALLSCFPCPGRRTQIIKIAQAHSAVGLSLPAYVLETLSYAISLAYAYRSSFPFSTYGENFFSAPLPPPSPLARRPLVVLTCTPATAPAPVTIQNVAITLQIIYYGARGSGAISTAGRDKQAAARQAKVLAMGAGMAVVGASLFSERILPAGARTSLRPCQPDLSARP